MFARLVPGAQLLRESHTVELLLMILPLLVPYKAGRPVPAAWVFRILLLMILPLLVPYNVAQIVPAAQDLEDSYNLVELVLAGI